MSTSTAADNIASLRSAINTDFFPSEFGGEFLRSDVRIDADGKTFTVRARNSFFYGTPAGKLLVNPGDSVRLDRDFAIVSVDRA